MRWTQQEYDAYLARRCQARTKVSPAEPERGETPALDQTTSGATESSGRVTIRFVFRRLRLLDRDNAHAGAKDLLDGLRYAGLISGDSEKEISLQVEQEKVAHISDQGTVIEIIW